MPNHSFDELKKVLSNRQWTLVKKIDGDIVFN